MAQEARQYRKGEIVGYVDPPAASCELPQGDPCWHVMVTNPNSEATATEALNEIGFRSYTPIIRKFTASPLRHANGQRKMVETTRAMFPGYVLADIRRGHHDFRKPLKAKGIRNYLLFHGMPCTLPANLVAAIREREAAEDRLFQDKLRRRHRAPFEPGEGVVIVDGPFRGFFAQVNRLDDKGRVELLLEMFNGKRKTWLSGGQLEKV